MSTEADEYVAARDAAHDAADQPTDPADTPPALDIAKVRRYQALRSAQAASEAEAKAMKDEANALENELIDMFSDAGLQNLNVDGKTVYLHRSVFAQRLPGKTADDVKAALLEVAPELVTTTVNAQTLSAWVRELTEDDDAPGLPDPVLEVLEAGERFSVRVIAGGSKKKSKTHSKG